MGTHGRGTRVTGYNCNSRSFDYASHDKTVRSSAQDDRLFFDRAFSRGLESMRLEAVGQVGGKLDGDQRSAAGVADNFKMRLVAVEDFEALLHILHADACAGAA